MRTKTLAALALSSAILTGCSKAPDPATDATPMTDNPLLSESELYLQYPPFDLIKDEHYKPALEQGMQEHIAEIDSIVSNPEEPTFENTILALENAGGTLARASRVFYSLASAHTNDTIEAVRAELAPELSAHSDAILLNDALFARVKAVYDARDSLGLDSESLRLVEENYKQFVLSGATLSSDQKTRMKEINARLAVLGTQFSQNVRNEVNAKAIVVDSAEELDGLSTNQIAAAKKAAEARDMPDKWVLPLLNTSGQPPLASLTNRALRQRIHETSLGRGSDGGEYDNTAIISEVMKLRAEAAQLMGFANHADYQLQTQTAGSVAAVNERLAGLAPPAVANARREAADLQAMIDAEGGDFELASWDWDFYTEKVSAAKYNFDGAQLKPYFEVNNVLEKGVFYAAEQVFGITFKRRTDLPVYQEDVQVWEVFNEDGSTLALFIQDFYARESKRGGAWMNAYVPQSHADGTKPVVANHLNIPKPADGEPTLLTWDEVTTMFHEFGHALHGMFSNVQYRSLAGTSVPRDFVEYPSMVNEMWAVWPEVLKNYAVHYETGEPMDPALLDKLLSSSQFNQGFSTTEYLAASLLDQAWHQLSPEEVPPADQVMAFEAQALTKAGVDFAPVPPRYRTPYFSHILGGYSAGYYSYIWSEVLDADTVEWFKENGGMLRENGDHFRNTLLSRGGSAEAMSLFENFRGRKPDITPLLKRRGLLTEAP